MNRATAVQGRSSKNATEGRSDPLKVVFALIIVLELFAGITFAQKGRPENIGDLYKQGHFTKIIEEHSKSSDPTELLYLGLAYERSGRSGDAIKAFQRSFRSGYSSFEKDLLRLYESKGLTKGQIPSFLTTSATLADVVSASIQKCVQLKQSCLSESEWAMRAQFMYELDLALESGETIYPWAETDTDVSIRNNPRPEYPDAARHSGVQGKVELLALFGRDGKVRAAIPIKHLKAGLTEEAYRAALKTSFVPAEKGGKAVSSLRKIEYTFSLF